MQRNELEALTMVKTENQRDKPEFYELLTGVFSQ